MDEILLRLRERIRSKDAGDTDERMLLDTMDYFDNRIKRLENRIETLEHEHERRNQPDRIADGSITGEMD